MIYRSDVMMQQPQQQGKQVKPIKRSNLYIELLI